MSDNPPPDWAPRPAEEPPGWTSPPGDLPPPYPPPYGGAGPPPGPAPYNTPFEPPPNKFGCAASGCGKALLVGMVLAVFLALLIGGCSLLLYRSVRPVVDEANEFLADLATDNVPAALDHVSSDPECFGASPREELSQFDQQFDIVSYNLSGSSVQSNQTGPTTGEASGTATLADGRTGSLSVSMIREGDDWKVCGIFYR